MTRQEIITALVCGTWDHEDYECFYEALKDVRGQVNTVAKYQFQPGDRVRFEGRRGKIVTGTVERLMQKNVRVTADGGVGWRVSPSVLTKIA